MGGQTKIMFPSPAIIKRGPVLNGPTALPATTEMLVLDASGNITTQSIPVASFGALTGSPSDNAALASALGAKVDKSGDTMTGTLTAPEYRSPRAGSMGLVNPKDKFMLYSGFAG